MTNDKRNNSNKLHAKDTVLMFEGGGMRASYTSAIAVALMENGITFDHVCGISAGSSNTVNFLSGDAWRTRASFVDLAANPRFGGIKTFLRGKGLFSAEWIYQKAGKPGAALPFDYEAFARNPTPCSIQAFDRDTGADIVWRREDLNTLDNLMARVRASSTLPVAMPAVHLNGHVYYDGGLGTGGGIPLALALGSGCSRIFAVLTRPKGFRKPPTSAAEKAIANLHVRYPHLREALLTRNGRYNAELDRLEQLAEQGRAYIVYADDMSVENSTTNVEQLRKSYLAGAAQAQAELPSWLDWL